MKITVVNGSRVFEVPACSVYCQCYSMQSYVSKKVHSSSATTWPALPVDVASSPNDISLEKSRSAWDAFSGRHPGTVNFSVRNVEIVCTGQKNQA